MSLKERDPVTGHQTTGHEWNGITELNTHVPRVVWVAIAVTVLCSLIMWVLLPAWPSVNSFTKGVLGVDQQDEVAQSIELADISRSEWMERIAALPVADIQNDPELLLRATSTAGQIFGDNCAGCHGQDAAGGPGFPSLIDDVFLWGGDADTIMETLRVGINSPHREARWAQMLAFGRDGILEGREISILVDYVRSLSGHEISPERASAGADLFADNCASCHGESGAGVIDLGAPNLTDDFWIYGGSRSAILETIRNGRQGWMPTFETRLSEAERKMVTVYLLNLAQGASQ